MRNKLSSIGVLAVLLLLSGCSASSKPVVTHAPVSVPSTLTGETISSPGVSVREVHEDYLGKNFASKSSPLTVTGANTAVLESGGPTTPGCEANFTKIWVDGNKINLTSRIGDGTASDCAAGTYKARFFLITSETSFTDATTFNVYVGDKLVMSYDMFGGFLPSSTGEKASG